jgi:hypothetical protein
MELILRGNIELDFSAEEGEEENNMEFLSTK